MSRNSLVRAIEYGSVEEVYIIATRPHVGKIVDDEIFLDSNEALRKCNTYNDAFEKAISGARRPYSVFRMICYIEEDPLE